MSEYRLTYRVAGLVKAAAFSSLASANGAARWLFEMGYAPAIERLS